MESTITIPPPDEIKAEIVRRREELKQLKQLLKLSAAASSVQTLSAIRRGESDAR